jgi:hypothetical protein
VPSLAKVPKKAKDSALLSKQVLKNSMALHTVYTKENKVTVREAVKSRVSQM